MTITEKRNTKISPCLPDHINNDMEGEEPWRVMEASLPWVVVAWRLSF